MIVDKSSWHARLYFWWHKQKRPNGSEPTVVNLCPYVRTVLLWAPLRFVFLHRFVRWISWPLLLGFGQFGLYLMGPRAMKAEKFFLMSLVIGTAFIATMAGVIWFHDRIKDVDSVKSFGRVLDARLEAAHDKICPVIELK